MITYPPLPNPPDPGPYYAFVNRVLPEVQQLLLPAVQEQLNGIRAELGKKVGAVLDRSRD